MAKPPSTDTDKGDNIFLREVDDALRRSNLEEFMRRYGWWVLGGVLALLLAWGGYIYWHNRKAEAAGNIAEDFVQALDKIEKSPSTAAAAEALSTFETMGEEGTPGYRASAKMMQANMHAARGETKKAIDLYKLIAADEDVAGPFRDLALIRSTLLELDDLKPQQVIERMQPLAEPGAPFFGTAGELTALAMMEADRKEEAGKLFSEIARDETVPPEIRQRSSMMANQLGIDLDLENEKAAKAVQQGDSPNPSKATD